MRLAFMGTAAFAVPSLEALVSAGHSVRAVFTQPDRPSGRGRKVHFSPIKETALALGLGVEQPESFKTDSVRELIENLSPELIVVVAYGRILPPWLIELPPNGIVNVHGSLLPKYRGAAPINRAIANGDPVTGVCTMQIDEGMDTGPVYFCDETPIAPEETAPELASRLAAIGATLLVRTLGAIGQGEPRPTPQDDRRASLAPRLRKEEGYIDWHEPAEAIHNKVRAFLPWPSVAVKFRGKTCRILNSQHWVALEKDREPEKCEPGAIVFVSNHLRVCCGDGGWLEIGRLQLENKNAVSGADFANGVHLVPGDRFTAIERP